MIELVERIGGRLIYRANIWSWESVPTVFGHMLASEFCDSGYHLGMSWDGELLVVYGHDEIVGVYTPRGTCKESAETWVRRTIREDQTNRWAYGIDLMLRIHYGKGRRKKSA